MPEPLVGQRLGPYEIRSLLGAGRMGEVYRARDIRLGRDVAIKILPAGFTADADRRARFEREARVLAALNHPHIGGIYGLEHREDIHGLVLDDRGRFPGQSEDAVRGIVRPRGCRIVERE